MELFLTERRKSHFTMLNGGNQVKLLLPPANEVWGKVIFLHSVNTYVTYYHYFN